MPTITRTWPARYIGSYFRETDNPTAAAQASNGQIQTINSSFTNFKTSTNNPKWRRQVQLHQNATTGREIDESKWKDGFGYIEVRYWRNHASGKQERYNRAWGVITPVGRPSIPSFSTAENLAKSRFWKKAKAQQTAFNGLTALGELAETLRMLRNPAQGLRRGLDDYLGAVTNRTRRANKRSLPGIVSDTWLEHVFGWQPLINDVRDAGEALNRRSNRYAGIYTRISGSATDEQASFSNVSNDGFMFGLNYVGKGLTKHYVSVRFYGQWKNECESPVEANTNLFGVNWRDIVPSAWELIPYSFLADYFTNIGDVLSAWSVRKSNIAWVSRTVNIRSVAKRHNVIIDYSQFPATVGLFLGYISKYADFGDSSCTRRYVHRKTESPGLPDFRLEMPGFGTKWINMSALLLSRNAARRQIFS